MHEALQELAAKNIFPFLIKSRMISLNGWMKKFIIPHMIAYIAKKSVL